MPLHTATPEEPRGFSPATPAVSSPARSRETIIVGGGIAGLACARHLHDAQLPFVVVSENVGGRIRRSRDGTVNLGAYYVRADYTHVNRYVQLGRRVDRLAIQRCDAEDNSNTYLDRRLVPHLPQAARFLRLLVHFRRHYAILKQRTVGIGQAAAIRSDPKLLELYHQPAPDFIERHRLSELASEYLEPGLHGTTFTSLSDISAFTLLLGALPVLVPTYEFTPMLDRLMDGFTDAVVTDTVTRVSRYGAGYHVETATNGTLTAERLVIATPTDVASRLLGLPAAKRPVGAHMFYVEGTLRDRHRRADILLFRETDATLAIARQENGAILVSSRQRHPDFNRLFVDWRVVEHKHWDPAFHIIGDDILECEQGPNLYLVGDHNIVSLEDACLTGLYAANQIIAKTQPLDDAAPRQPSLAQQHAATAGPRRV